MSVKSKIRYFANVDDEAFNKLLNSMSIALTELKSMMSSSKYSEYSAIPEDNHDDINDPDTYVSDELLTESQLFRRNIESAHALFVLYYGIPYLKQMQINVVTLDKLDFGRGQLDPSDISSLDKLRQIYYSQAVRTCNNYSDDGMIKSFVI